MISDFKIHIPDDRLATIRSKVAAYDWDQFPDTGDWSDGVPKADLRRLTNHWLTKFDWRSAERRLNQLPQFIAEVDGNRIHFIHLKGNGSKPPLLLLHGWPGSFIEFEALVKPLMTDGHDVVVPSLPGFAFSNPITGITGPRRAAELMHTLMRELFSDSSYIVQGGDWGAHIASWMGQLFPDALLGFHINMVAIFAKDAVPTTPEEKDWFARRAKILDLETGYNHQQETRPQTLGIAMADSPVGAAGWILEKFGVWADLPKRADGGPDLWSRFTEDQMLTNIMLYLGPSAVVTSTWIYRGKRLEGSERFPEGTRVRTPMGIAAFPDPVFIPTPRSFAEKTYNVVHYSKMAKGGHFAALEEPELMLADFRAFIGQVAVKMPERAFQSMS